MACNEDNSELNPSVTMEFTKTKIVTIIVNI